MLRHCLAIALLVVTSAQLIAFAEDDQSKIAAAAREIDRLLNQAWQRDGITPSPPADDYEFCRRVWLDLAGVAPPVFELHRYAKDARADKRARLIDKLLRSPRYASHMASRWLDILLPSDAQEQLQNRQNVAALHDWLQEQFLKNTPYDHLVGGFLTAGGASDSGPAIFYTSYSLEPEKLAAATSQIFMGLQLQCAQCHNHPSDRWTQEDFWQYAAFFAQLKQTDGRMAGDTIIEDEPGGEVMLPETEIVMSPRYPGISAPPEENPGDNRRRQLTIWMASRDNPYFARAAANRVWAHLFGRGLVDPVDAMDAGNDPSHPELLDHLTRFLIDQRFDLRNLYAAIAQSEAYGRTSAVSGERPPQDSFAAMDVKTLTARQFFDSLQQNVYRKSAVMLGDRGSPDRVLREQFLSRMRAPGATPRDYPHGVVQALGLMNGPEVTTASGEHSSALLGAIQAPFFDDDQRIETIFLATLSRKPSKSELTQFRNHLASSESSTHRAAALSDVLWILLNTAECAVCP